MTYTIFGIDAGLVIGWASFIGGIIGIAYAVNAWRDGKRNEQNSARLNMKIARDNFLVNVLIPKRQACLSKLTALMVLYRNNPDHLLLRRTIPATCFYDDLQPLIKEGHNYSKDNSYYQPFMCDLRDMKLEIATLFDRSIVQKYSVFLKVSQQVIRLRDSPTEQTDVWYKAQALYDKFYKAASKSTCMSELYTETNSDNFSN